MDHLSFMQMAVEEAVQGMRRGEGGPFGAVIVRDGKVIGKGHNTVLVSKDPTAHAEVNAIRNACRNENDLHLDGAVIYSNFEPCPMCLAAIYWAGIQTAEKIYKDLSTEFTDLKGLIKKMGSEKLTGYIDISIGNGEQNGIIFLINGKIRGGLCSWGNGMPSLSGTHQELLIQKTKEQGGTFNVCRIALNNLPIDSTPTDAGQARLETAIVMMEALLAIFETVVRENTKKKNDFQKLLKQNLVESAERFAFLDPFAGEFEYAQQSITFSGRASNRDLVQGVCAVVKKMAHDLGLYSALLQKLESWSEEYADELLYYDVNLTEIGI